MLGGLGMAYYHRGMMLAQDNRITAAIDSLEDSIGLYPNNWKALNVLGLCLYGLGEFSRAKEAWQRSIKEYEEENPAWEYLSELESLDFISIVKIYNEALEHGSKGDYRRALRDLEGLGEKHVQFVSFLNLMGLYSYGAGKRRKALSLWGKALDLDKDNSCTRGYLQEFEDRHPLTSLLNRIWTSLTRVFSFYKKGVDLL